MFFEQKVDRRSRARMEEFLAGHYRYHTMNSWNRGTSYANRVKIRHLGLTREQDGKAYDILNSDYRDELDYVIDDFTSAMGGHYTIGSNGRSGGYLVLYNSRYEDTGYKSFCRSCGQKNYTSVAEPFKPGTAEAVIGAEILRSGGSWRKEVYLTQPAVQSLAMSDAEKLEIVHRLLPILKGRSPGNRCGHCGAEGERGRVNYTNPHLTLRVSGSGINENQDFSEMSLGDLRNRVDLVCRFDRACDEMRQAFIDLLDDCEVVTETVMVPKTITRLCCSASV